jgi:hypothetical protein
MVGTTVLLTLAFVLVSAALAKAKEGRGLLALAEFAVATGVVLLPGRISGALLAVAFGGFTLAHARRWRNGLAGCECFGAGSKAGASPVRSAVITMISALAALVVTAAGAPSLLSAHAPATAVARVVGLAALASILWRVLFSVEPSATGGLADALVRSSAFALERIALVGSALAVAPIRYLLYPGSALAVISPATCAGGLCTDGWTAFCCQINGGLNSCPEGTFAGGWWMCTDYTGHRLCADQGVRYYVDCNALPGTTFPGGCHCANGTCDERRVACNVFRYGQCNTQIPGVTPVVCRTVVCENPSTIAGLNCTSSLAVDNLVCGHDAPCLVPDALQLAGAGGV